MATTLLTLRERLRTQLTDSGESRWTDDELEEALTQAVQQYSQVAPQRKIASVTLTAAGREIDLSDEIDGLLAVERVWWDYDEDDPDHPPNWRDFDLWPGDVLYILDDEEPDSGDVVRVFYTLAHTVDVSESTVLPPDEATVLVGGCAYAALSRAMARSERLNDNSWAVRNLREWGQERMAAFERALEGVARREATRRAGIAEAPALDRWDEEWW